MKECGGDGRPVGGTKRVRADGGYVGMGILIVFVCHVLFSLILLIRLHSVSLADIISYRRLDVK